jgi:hypothetical protein
MRQVFFQIQSLMGDKIIAINGSSINPIAADEFACANLGDYYIMKNTAGELTLCGDCPLMQGIELTMLDTNDHSYTIKGCDFVGGRPPVTR